MDWKEFSIKSADILERFQSNQIDMNKAFRELDNLSSFRDQEILEFIQNTISEIDSIPKSYEETIIALKELDLTQFKKLMNS